MVRLLRLDSAGGVRRRAQEKAIGMTLEFLKKTVPKRSSKARLFWELDHNSGLVLKGASEQVEETFAEEFHRDEQKRAGHEMESVLRNTDSPWITTMYSESGPTYFSPQGTSKQKNTSNGKKKKMGKCG